ncbi:MAG: hypothetical protein IKE21_06115 [Erysipelotrichaceae bacterium]|nr:hypothetical protein [Erysipelotrichaceae bacterium]
MKAYDLLKEMNDLPEEWIEASAFQKPKKKTDYALWLRPALAFVLVLVFASALRQTLFKGKGAAAPAAASSIALYNEDAAQETADEGYASAAAGALPRYLALDGDLYELSDPAVTEDMLENARTEEIQAAAEGKKVYTDALGNAVIVETDAEGESFLLDGQCYRRIAHPLAEYQGKSWQLSAPADIPVEGISEEVFLYEGNVYWNLEGYGVWLLEEVK